MVVRMAEIRMRMRYVRSCRNGERVVSPKTGKQQLRVFVCGVMRHIRMAYIASLSGVEMIKVLEKVMNGVLLRYEALLLTVNRRHTFVAFSRCSASNGMSQQSERQQ
ncbi:hypothetical protein IX307_001870 [Bacteroides pyogenes]|nr:hypothetical protein [Bacteroides pyogenes]MBR8720694.1 hypothetical protein [Bacteroides pyogenes]MBR8725736.1 hypothetical protein [Bacteroides pyogenes]MBR8738983.1 hypothetical protein [Bacteroides pyogenes]MBR8754779.1 hypothetical protein [Bacteroides pyogenes]